MKKRVLGIAAALTVSAAATITAGAEYYISTEQDDNKVKVEIIATGATLPAIEFTTDFPDDVVGIEDIYLVDNSFYNEEKGIFAWAGIEAPKDGTVMYSVTFIVDDDYKGEFTVNPVEGYEEEMPIALTAEIVGKVGEAEGDNTSESADGNPDNETDNTDDENPSESDEETDGMDTSEPSDDTSDTNGDISDSTDGDANPDTGITISVATVAVAGAAFVAAFKNKKQK